MYEHLWLIFWWYPHATTFFTPKTFLLHAVYVEFHLPGTLKLLYYALLCVCVIYMYIYRERESQIVHPTPQCFKSFYPVYFVNDS